MRATTALLPIGAEDSTGVPQEDCRIISRSPPRARRRDGFSRLEVCVTLCVLAVLAAIFVPAIQRARESARRSQCQNHLKSLGLALHNYHDVYRSFPSGCVGNASLPPEQRWSWWLCIGSYWGHYGTPVIDYERPWDDPALRPLHLHTWLNGTTSLEFEEFDIPLRPIPIIKCPNGTEETHSDGQPFADYVGTAGIGSDAAILDCTSKRAGAWSYTAYRTLKDITDGTSNTLLVMETGHENGCWLAGGPASVRACDTDQTPIRAGRQFGGLHDKGCMALFADGHVRLLSDAIDPQLLSAYLTIAGSEPIPDETGDAP